MNKYFSGVILLASISYSGCLTIAIADAQITTQIREAQSLQTNQNKLKTLEANEKTEKSSHLKIAETNIHQELNAIANTSLVTAVLDGKLKTETPPAATEYPTLSPKTIAIIQEFEGFRSTAYFDTDGTPVIGYGQSKIQGKSVQIGDRISPLVADEALKNDLTKIQQEILASVKVDLNSNQLGALISLAFNTGVDNLKNSTLVKKLNQKDYSGAANEFLRWDKANINGKLLKMNGLSKRRAKEKQLFLSQ